MMNRLKVLLVFILFYDVVATSESKIRELNKRFEASVTNIYKKVKCRVVTIKEHNGCMLKAFADKCLIQPTLDVLHKDLFPLTNLEKLSGGFLINDKLAVVSYTLDLCNRNKSSIQLSLHSRGTYDLADRYINVDKVELNIQFSATHFIKTLSDIIIDSGHASVNINNKNIDIYFHSLKNKSEITYDFKTDVLAIADILRLFQLHSLEYVFDRNILLQNKIALNTLIFLNSKVIGTSVPSNGFEFEISGKVNGNELLSNSKDVYLILQKHKAELTDVKCLIYADLDKQTPESLNKILQINNVIPKIPFFKPINQKVALTISNAEYSSFTGENINAALMQFVDLSRSNLVSKGVRYIYRLEKLKNNVLNGEMEDETSTSLPTVTSADIYPTIKVNSQTNNSEITESNKKQVQLSSDDGKNQTEAVTTEVPNLQSSFEYFQQYPQWNSYSSQQPLQQQWSNSLQQNLPFSSNFYFQPRVKREALNGEDNESGSGDSQSNHDNKNIAMDTEYFVYELQISKNDEIVVEPRQLVLSVYSDLMKYILGNTMSSGKGILPFSDNLELFLNKVVLNKVDDVLEIHVDVTQSTPFVIIDDFMEFKVLMFDIVIIIDGDKISWQLKSGLQNYQADGEKPPQVIFDDVSKKYYLNDVLDTFCQKDLIKDFGVSPLATVYENVFGELTKFPFKDPVVNVELNKDIHKAKIEATAVIFESTNVLYETYVWQQKKEKQITTGLKFNKIGLDLFLEDLYGKKMLKFCWLSMQKIYLLFSSCHNETIGDDIFSGETMIDRTSKYQDFIWLFGNININLKTSCLDDPVCNFIKNHITHQLELVIRGKIFSTSYHMISNELESSIAFGDVWGMSQVTIVIRGKNEKDSSVSVEGNIIHKETSNTGKFYVGTDKSSGNIVLKITLKESLDNYLGYNNLKLTNLKSNIDVSGDMMLKEIEFSSTLEIGNSSEPLSVRGAKVIINMNKKDENNDVVYGILQNITMSNLQNAFIGNNGHPLTNRMKFNDALRVCFTRKQGYQVEEFGLYSFNPTCNGVSEINTFAGDVTAQFDFNTMNFHFQPRQLKFAGEKLILQKSEKKDDGPYFMFPLSNAMNKSNKAFMKGYMKTIGYEGLFQQSFDSNEFNQSFTTLLFNKVKAKVNLHGPIDTDMTNGMYTVQLDLHTSRKSIRKQMQKYIENEATKIQKDIITTCEKLLQNISILITKMKDTRTKLNSLTEYKRSDVFRKKVDIDAANDYIKRDCINTCGKRCVTALDWDHDCSNIRGQKFGCLKWKECQSEAADTNCISICEAKKVPQSINAYVKRDEIRNLVEDISELRTKIQNKDTSLKSAENIFTKAKAEFENVQEKLSFIMNIDTKSSNLFEMTKSPVSEQLLQDIKPPCFKFDTLSYTFLSVPSTITKQQFCMDGNFYKDMAEAMVKGNIKKFERLGEIKNDLMVNVIGVEALYKEFKQVYMKEVSKEEDSEDAYSDLLSKNADIAKTSSDSFMEQPNTLFNDTSMGSGGIKEVLMKKRDVDDTDSKDDNHDALLDATEMEIADFVIKDSKTMKIFETESPWVYMNKKRGITIPPLGMLHFVDTIKNSSCVRRRNTIEHFEDLLGSLEDAKKFYDQGKKVIEKIREDLANQKRAIEEEILNAKDDVRSIPVLDDMTYWLKRSRDGISDYLTSASRQLEHQNKVGLKYWSTQLSSAVRSNIANKVSVYFNKLKESAMTTFKHSTKRSKIEGKDALESMTKEFITIAEKEPLLSELSARLNKLTKKINQFKKTTTCKP